MVIHTGQIYPAAAEEPRKVAAAQTAEEKVHEIDEGERFDAAFKEDEDGNSTSWQAKDRARFATIPFEICPWCVILHCLQQRGRSLGDDQGTALHKGTDVATPIMDPTKLAVAMSAIQLGKKSGSTMSVYVFEPPLLRVRMQAAESVPTSANTCVDGATCCSCNVPERLGAFGAQQILVLPLLWRAPAKAWV